MEFMNKLGYKTTLDYKNKLLYPMNLMSILVASLFLGIYIIKLPFLPAILVHIAYIIFGFTMFISLKNKHYSYVKFAIIIAHIFQLTLAVYLWFPIQTGYNLYYIMVPMVAFLVTRKENKREYYFAIVISLLAIFLFFFSVVLPLDFYMYQTSETMNRFLYSMSILMILLPMTYIFTKFSNNLDASQKQLNVLANTDDLTKIANRRVLYEHGLEAFSKAKVGELDFSLLLFDIDYFKKINDQYGHQVGDQVLQKLSELVTKNTRIDDTFSRYGGEEFAVLIRNVDKKQGVSIAHKLHEIIRNETLLVDEQMINITVSIGVTSYKKSIKDFDHMMKLVDQALYQAKNNGRDQVIYE